MAKITADRYGTRHTGRTIADTNSTQEGIRAVYHVGIHCSDQAGPGVMLEFRVTEPGGQAHVTHTVELTGQELVDLFRRVLRSGLQVDHPKYFDMVDQLRRIWMP